MTDNSRGSKLLDIVRRGLSRHSTLTTAALLGNRLDYVGMSDIGAYLTCPRMAILNKIHAEKGTDDLARLITLQRGHWFEEGIAEAFGSLNLPMVRQLEIDVTTHGIPIKAHLDFVFAAASPPTVRILEVKSCQKIPDSLYPSYELQVYGQLGLLSQYWKEPVFSVKDASGKYSLHGKTFPELAHHLWGIELPNDWRKVDREAWVLCLSMTEARAIGPYAASDEMLNLALSSGVKCWNGLQMLKSGTLAPSSMPTASGLNSLCERCAWNSDCPKFSGSTHPELAPQFDELTAWKAERASLDEKIKERELSVKEWYAHTPGTQGGWIEAGSQRFRAMEIAGRRILNKESLAGELEELFADKGLEIDVQALLARHEKTGAPSTRLFINTINRQEKKDGVQV
ncbi:hypothetical protein [uncultured Mailhella sp.]|uniref:hypothetical protein n=1 Tax=uncultured Mailhella sp. TaxID=1981031 RepID=UPI002626D925|nr:hypothetical protein [uncultured Mailhella sp.]